MAKHSGPRTVQCYLCGRRLEVGGRTMTTSCPGCNKPLMVSDVVVDKLQSVKKIQTCGRVVINASGRVIADLVEGHQGIEVRGTLDAKAVAGGDILIGKKAKWKGDCRACTLTIERGAVITGSQFVIPDATLGFNDLVGRDG